MLPYRPNVGAVLFNRAGLVFVARRADLPKCRGRARWLAAAARRDDEEDEDPRKALVRELARRDRHRPRRDHRRASGVADLRPPPHLLGVALGGRYRGQKQRWFALRFTGADSDIRLDLDPHPEFDAWRWTRLAELPALAVDFKRSIYEVLARSFARFAAD